MLFFNDYTPQNKVERSNNNNVYHVTMAGLNNATYKNAAISHILEQRQQPQTQTDANRVGRGAANNNNIRNNQVLFVAASPASSSSSGGSTQVSCSVCGCDCCCSSSSSSSCTCSCSCSCSSCNHNVSTTSSSAASANNHNSSISSSCSTCTCSCSECGGGRHKNHHHNQSPTTSTPYFQKTKRSNYSTSSSPQPTSSSSSYETTTTSSPSQNINNNNDFHGMETPSPQSSSKNNNNNIHSNSNKNLPPHQQMSASRNYKGEWICEECRSAELKMRNTYLSPSFKNSTQSRSDPVRQKPLADYRSASELLSCTPLLRLIRPGGEGAAGNNDDEDVNYLQQQQQQNQNMKKVMSMLPPRHGGSNATPSGQQQQNHDAEYFHSALGAQVTFSSNNNNHSGGLDQATQQNNQNESLAVGFMDAFLNSDKNGNNHNIQEEITKDDDNNNNNDDNNNNTNNSEEQLRQKNDTETAPSSGSATTGNQQPKNDENNSTINTQQTQNQNSNNNNIVRIYIRDSEAQTDPVKIQQEDETQADYLNSNNNDDHKSDNHAAAATSTFSVECQSPCVSTRTCGVQHDEQTIPTEQQQQQQPNVSNPVPNSNIVNQNSPPAAVVSVDVTLFKQIEQDDANVQVDTIFVELEKSICQKLERLQLQELEQRQMFQEFSFEILTSTFQTCSDLLRTVRFTGDSTQAKIHNLRQDAETAAFQLVLQQEIIFRQRNENLWMSAFVSTIMPQEENERNALHRSELEKTVSEQEELIEKLNKKIYDEKVATTAIEHLLRDKLKKALMFAEQSSTSSRNLRNNNPGMAPSGFSFVDVNLPVEVRFARAHVIAMKAVEMEKQGAKYPQHRVRKNNSTENQEGNENDESEDQYFTLQNI